MFIEKEEYIEKALLTLDENYNEFLPILSKILMWSRMPILKNWSIFIGALQMNMLKKLAEIHEMIRLGNRKLRENLSEKDRKGYQDALKRNYELARAIQTIGDGIAFRKFQFNRPLLRVMSENDSGVHIDPQYLNRVTRKFVVRFKDFLIVNDLTRFLRIADLTRVTRNNKIILYEIKKGGKKLIDLGYILDKFRKHRNLTPQEARQWAAQNAIMSGTISAPRFSGNKLSSFEDKAQIVNYDIKIKTHLRSVKSAIKEADRDGFSHRLLEPGFFIQVIAMDKINKNKEKLQESFVKSAEEFKQVAPEWCIDKEASVLKISNFDTFYSKEMQFVRNILPYSVFPFSSKDCMRLIMGHLNLHIYYNLDILKQRIVEDGWEVEEIDLDKQNLENQAATKNKKRGEMFAANYREELCNLRKQDDKGTLFVPLLGTYVMAIFTSFYKTEVILETLKYQHEHAKGRKLEDSAIAVNLLREKDVLI